MGHPLDTLDRLADGGGGHMYGSPPGEGGVLIREEGISFPFRQYHHSFKPIELPSLFNTI